jgi:hypothetical protein
LVFRYARLQLYNHQRANITWRAYNYPHPTTIYYSLYRIPRDNVNISTLHPWSWYLMQAYQTYKAMNKFGARDVQFGLMIASVFLHVMDALQAEGYIHEFEQILISNSPRNHDLPSL